MTLIISQLLQKPQSITRTMQYSLIAQFYTKQFILYASVFSLQPINNQIVAGLMASTLFTCSDSLYLIRASFIITSSSSLHFLFSPEFFDSSVIDHFHHFTAAFGKSHIMQLEGGFFSSDTLMSRTYKTSINC